MKHLFKQIFRVLGIIITIFSLGVVVYAQEGLPLPGVTTTLTEAQQLTIEGAKSFGQALAMDGNTLVIGAPETGSSRGKAYVFVRNGDNWTYQATLTPSDNGAYKYFGYSVALNGDTVLIGASNCLYSDCNQNQGAVYVFVRNGVTWKRQARLEVGDIHNFLGMQVALDGDTALITATRLRGPSDAMVYVFVRNGTTWSQQARLTETAGFGAALGLKGNVAVISSYWANESRGIIYIYERSGTTWHKTAEILNPEGKKGGYFGVAIDFDGSRILVGAGMQKATYLFVKRGGSWVLDVKFNVSGTSTGDSVALNGDLIIITETDYINHTGGAHVFEFDGISWVKKNELTARDGLPGDYFGASVALNGNMAIIGTFYANIVYVFPQVLTPDNAIELLINRSFEIDNNGDNSPDDWEAINPTGDVRRCTPAGKPPQAVEGKCYYNFHDVVDENSDLKQDINVSSYTMAAGDTLTLDGYVNAVGPVVNTRVRILVKYVNEAIPSDKIVVTYLAPTDGWKVLPAGQSITLAGEPRVVRVILNNLGTEGRVRYDYMSLKLNKNAASLIPLPK